MVRATVPTITNEGINLLFVGGMVWRIKRRGERSLFWVLGLVFRGRPLFLAAKVFSHPQQRLPLGVQGVVRPDLPIGGVFLLYFSLINFFPLGRGVNHPLPITNLAI
jgi:hypothetical protein